MKILRVGFALLMILVLMVAAVGCQSAEQPSEAKETSADTSKEVAETDASKEVTEKNEDGYVIAWSPLWVGNSYQTQNWDLLQEIAKQYPEVKEVVLANPEFNAETQITLIQNLIDQGVDAIIMQAVSPTALVPVVEQAVEAGIVVIMQDCMVDSDAPTSRVYVDDNEWSRVTGEWLVEKMGGSGKVVVLNGIAGNTTNELRWAEASKILSTTEGIEILAEANCDWEKAKAQATMASWIAAYPEINGVWSQGGEMTAAAIDEFLKADRPLVPMTGEAYNGFLKLWKQHRESGFTSIAPALPCYNVQISLELAIRKLKGEEIPGTVVVPLPLVTEENLDEYCKEDMPDDYWVFDKLTDQEVADIIASAK